MVLPYGQGALQYIRHFLKPLLLLNILGILILCFFRQCMGVNLFQTFHPPFTIRVTIQLKEYVPNEEQ